MCFKMSGEKLLATLRGLLQLSKYDVQNNFNSIKQCGHFKWLLTWDHIFINCVIFSVMHIAQTNLKVINNHYSDTRISKLNTWWILYVKETNGQMLFHTQNSIWDLIWRNHLKLQNVVTDKLLQNMTDILIHVSLIMNS